MSSVKWSREDKLVITVTAPPRLAPEPAWDRLARHVGRRHLLIGGVAWMVARVGRSAA